MPKKEKNVNVGGKNAPNARTSSNCMSVNIATTSDLNAKIKKNTGVIIDEESTCLHPLL